ncbi:MAG: hypothetical protein ACRDYX_11875, partial [Egibacteraceae bacterium]
MTTEHTANACAFRELRQLPLAPPYLDDESTLMRSMRRGRELAQSSQSTRVLADGPLARSCAIFVLRLIPSTLGLRIPDIGLDRDSV